MPTRTAVDLKTILAPLNDRAEAIEKELSDLKEKYEKATGPLTEELKGIRRVQRAADPDNYKKPGPKTNGHAPQKVSATVLQKSLDWCQRQGDNEFRQSDFREQESVQSTSASATAFKALKDDGVIRFVRQDGNNKYWKLTGAEPSAGLLEALGR